MEAEEAAKALSNWNGRRATGYLPALLMCPSWLFCLQDLLCYSFCRVDEKSLDFDLWLCSLVPHSYLWFISEWMISHLVSICGYVPQYLTLTYGWFGLVFKAPEDVEHML